MLPSRDGSRSSFRIFGASESPRGRPVRRAARRRRVHRRDLGAHGYDGSVGLTGLDKPIVPPAEPYYDIRVLADNVKMITGTVLMADTLLRTLVESSRCS
jgi:hypothetical protein